MACPPVWRCQGKIGHVTVCCKRPIAVFVVHIFFSVAAFLGNGLILVTLHKESSLHLPSKLLYRILAITDLFVCLVSLFAAYWISLVHEHWSLCRYARDAAYITSSALSGASIMTMMAIGVDRLLALLLGLRCRQIATLKSTYIIVAPIWVLSLIVSFSPIIDIRIAFVTATWLYHFSWSFCLSPTQKFLALSEIIITGRTLTSIDSFGL